MRVSVKERMTGNPVSIVPDASALEALELMGRHGIHHLPVVVDGVLVGILSTSDFMKLHVLKGRAAALAKIKVSQVMESDPVTLDVFADLLDVASKLVEGAFHALPVIEADNVLVGIVTSSDLINHILMQVPRGDGSLRIEKAPEPGRRLSDADMASAIHNAREAVRGDSDEPLAAALLHLAEENRLLREISKAAELYMRSGHGEHEHSVLIKALADAQRHRLG